MSRPLLSVPQLGRLALVLAFWFPGPLRPRDDMGEGSVEVVMRPYEQRLRAFYFKHSPDKLHTVDSVSAILF